MDRTLSKTLHIERFGDSVRIVSYARALEDRIILVNGREEFKEEMENLIFGPQIKDVN